MYFVDLTLSVLPLIVALSAFVLLAIRYYKFKQTHHLYMFIIFGLLSVTYLISFTLFSKLFHPAAMLFPLRQPIILMLIPFSTYFCYALFLGTLIPLRRLIIHILPALFVFIGFIPFWFLPSELQESYLIGNLKDNYGDMILRNTETLHLLSTCVIFNAQFIIYNVFVILKFRNFDKKSPVTLHTHPGVGIIAITLLFFSFLLVLINYAYFLGVTIYQGSRIFFNSTSTIVLFLVFLAGYLKKQSIVSEKLSDSDEEDSEYDL